MQENNLNYHCIPFFPLSFSACLALRTYFISVSWSWPSNADADGAAATPNVLRSFLGGIGSLVKVARATSLLGHAAIFYTISRQGVSKTAVMLAQKCHLKKIHVQHILCRPLGLFYDCSSASNSMGKTARVLTQKWPKNPTMSIEGPPFAEAQEYAEKRDSIYTCWSPVRNCLAAASLARSWSQVLLPCFLAHFLLPGLAGRGLEVRRGTRKEGSMVGSWSW